MTYRNKFEKDTAKDLEKHNIKFGYEQTKIPYTVSGNYLVDFEITTKSGNTVYIETKGNGRSFDGHAKRKMIAVKKQHPDLDIRIVFYNDGKCGPKRKDGTYMRQMEWAAKYGFKASVRSIPEDWYNE